MTLPPHHFAALVHYPTCFAMSVSYLCSPNTKPTEGGCLHLLRSRQRTCTFHVTSPRSTFHRMNRIFTTHPPYFTYHMNMTSLSLSSHRTSYLLSTSTWHLHPLTTARPWLLRPEPQPVEPEVPLSLLDRGPAWSRSILPHLDSLEQ